jgi:hypothetical protein
LDVLSRNRQATLSGDVSIRVEDAEIIAGKLAILHCKCLRVAAPFLVFDTVHKRAICIKIMVGLLLANSRFHRPGAAEADIPR